MGYVLGYTNFGICFYEWLYAQTPRQERSEESRMILALSVLWPVSLLWALLLRLER